MRLIYKATYHDTQTSYNWQAHIEQAGKVACGRELSYWWDQYSKEYNTLKDMFAEHDPSGICHNCRHSKRLTMRAADKSYAGVVQW